MTPFSIEPIGNCGAAQPELFHPNLFVFLVASFVVLLALWPWGKLSRQAALGSAYRRTLFVLLLGYAIALPLGWWSARLIMSNPLNLAQLTGAQPVFACQGPPPNTSAFFGLGSVALVGLILVLITGMKNLLESRKVQVGDKTKPQHHHALQAVFAIHMINIVFHITLSIWNYLWSGV